MLDLDIKNIDLESYIERAVENKGHIVIADDSIGTGATYERIKRLMELMPVTWVYAVFYVDGAFNSEDKEIKYVMKTNQWVVLPYEDPELIEVGNQNSLFRNGTDPYQATRRKG